MSSKLNVGRIVKDHLDTMRDEGTGRLSSIDIFSFFAVPILVAGVSSYFNWRFSSDAISAAISSLSIFAGLLINVLVLIYTVSLNQEKQVNQENQDRIDLERRYLEQIFANISCSILVAVVATILFVVLSMAGTKFPGLSAVVHFACVALILNFVLTLIMCLKRIHMLLSRKVK